jgi:hypothetical protein
LAVVVWMVFIPAKKKVMISSIIKSSFLQKSSVPINIDNKSVSFVLFDYPDRLSLIIFCMSALNLYTLRRYLRSAGVQVYPIIDGNN